MCVECVSLAALISNDGISHVTIYGIIFPPWLVGSLDIGLMKKTDPISRIIFGGTPLVGQNWRN